MEEQRREASAASGQAAAAPEDYRIAFGGVRLDAASLGTKPVDLRLSPAEKKAAALIPTPLPKIMENGFGGYQAAIQEARKAMGTQPAGPGRGASRNTAEIQHLCDGRTSALDIKKMLDTQYRTETSLEAVIAHLELLKKAGLVSF